MSELQSAHREINRLFNTLFDAPAPVAGAGRRRWVPAMDLVETDSHFAVRADLPGISEKDVKIELQDNLLTVSGQRRTEHEERKEGYFRLERASGAFSRSLTLPEGVDASRITATFTHGVLEIHVPKPEVRKPQKVEISVGTSEKPAETIEGSESSTPNGSDPALTSASA